MKLIIEVHHTIKLDSKFAELLDRIFPSQQIIDALAADIAKTSQNVKEKTTDLQNTIETNTP